MSMNAYALLLLGALAGGFVSGLAGFGTALMALGSRHSVKICPRYDSRQVAVLTGSGRFLPAKEPGTSNSNRTDL